MRSAIAVATAAVLALGVVVLGFVAVGAYLDLGELRERRAAGDAALVTARAAAPDLLSYDYRTIEEDLARAGRLTTGQLTAHYRELAETLVGKAKEQRTVQQATVAGAAVEKANADRVEVLLFVNMGTTKETPGTTEARQQVIQNRVRFVMVRQDSGWRVAELSTLLGSP